VLFTAKRMQLVVMTLQGGEEIGEEPRRGRPVHPVEAGTGKAILDGEESNLEDGSVVVIPAGTRHNIGSRSDSQPLKLFTLYSPPEHPDGTVHRDKAEAMAYEAEHHE
jgi:mannose-6-phosphate isomerase-like protein (cupin superfamily)